MRQIQSVAFRPQQPSQRQHLQTWSTFCDNDGKDNNDTDGDDDDYYEQNYDGSDDDGDVNFDEMITSARRATRLGETMMMLMMMMTISMRIVIINLMVRIV